MSYLVTDLLSDASTNPTVANHPVSYLSQDLVSQFLSSLLHERNFQPQTNSVSYVALKDPLWYGFRLRLDNRLVNLLCKGWFHQRPPPRHPHPLWLLQKVLDYLVSPLFSSEASAKRKLEKVLFLIALASGTQFPDFMPSPIFLPKLFLPLSGQRFP